MSISSCLVWGWVSASSKGLGSLIELCQSENMHRQAGASVVAAGVIGQPGQGVVALEYKTQHIAGDRGVQEMMSHGGLATLATAGVVAIVAGARHCRGYGGRSSRGCSVVVHKDDAAVQVEGRL